MYKQNLLILTALLFAWVGVNAQRVAKLSNQTVAAPKIATQQTQTPERKVRCYTMEAEARRIANDPTAESLDQFEQWLQKQIADPKVQSKARTVYNIPVIVHVIHNGTGVGAGSNISQAQVNSQFDVLNEDFRHLNADATNTPSVFASVAADCEINFCKAMVDPSGNALAEPGIHRVNRTTAGFSAPPYSNAYVDATIKPATVWDPTRYLNIWVCDLGGDLLGYAQFPTGSGLSGLSGGATSANTDGVVILYNAFGRVGNVMQPYHKGRSATHEIGHWLGLRHIGGDGSNCSATDYCNDTPPQKGGFSGGQFNQNYGCPTFPYQSGCSTTNGDMFMNYMDYVDDGCMNLFTANQKTRMQTVMSVSPRRASLNTSTVCNSVVPTAPVASFTFAPTSPCAGSAITLTNTSTGAPTAYTWAMPGGTPSSASTLNASTTYATPGTYTITLTVSNAQGTNTTTQNIIVKDCSSTGGCDTLINIDAVDTLSTGHIGADGYVAGHNSYSDKAFADYFTYTSSGNTAVTDVILGFGKADAISTAGKVTAHIWANNGGTPGAVLGSVDVPLSTIASDVAAQSATIATFATPVPITGNFFAGIEIYYTSGDTAALIINLPGNTPGGTAWTWLSDGTWSPFTDGNLNWGMEVSLYVAPVVCKLNTVESPTFSGNVSIYPNPSEGKFTFAMTKASAKETGLAVYNLQGQKVFEKTVMADNGAVAEVLDLSSLANGTYFLTVSNNGERITHKIMIAK